MTAVLFHVALPHEWAAAQREGSYRRSTRGTSLEEVGFVHCSYAHQVSTIANARYADLPEVLVLTIDPELLDARWVSEPGEPGGEDFPHVYGPVDLDAVVAVTPWSRGPAGYADADRLGPADEPGE